MTVKVTEIKSYTADFAGQETPVIEVTGDGAGPLLSVIAGVHGCEYASMAGVRRCVSGLAGRSLRGTVKVVPIVNLSAFRARSPFVVPEDGKNPPPSRRTACCSDSARPEAASCRELL
jgi:uncharacterized protein